MVDIHCHVIPEVDDGAASIEVTQKMLEEAAGLGITRIVATPHIDYRYEKEFLDDVLAKFASARLIAEKVGIELTIGAEIFVNPDIFNLVKENPEFHLDIHNSVILIEDGFVHQPIGLKEIVFDLQMKGKKIVIAHPERYKWLAESEDYLDFLSNSGVIFQLDAGSLTGSYSRRSHAFGWKLIEMGYAHCVGSDAHNLTGRSFKELQKAEALVLDKKGEEIREILFEKNPLNIINGGNEIKRISVTEKPKNFLNKVSDIFRK